MQRLSQVFKLFSKGVFVRLYLLRFLSDLMRLLNGVRPLAWFFLSSISFSCFFLAFSIKVFVMASLLSWIWWLWFWLTVCTQTLTSTRTGSFWSTVAFRSSPFVMFSAFFIFFHFCFLLLFLGRSPFFGNHFLLGFRYAPKMVDLCEFLHLKAIVKRSTANYSIKVDNRLLTINLFLLSSLVALISLTAEVIQIHKSNRWFTCLSFAFWFCCSFSLLHCDTYRSTDLNLFVLVWFWRKAVPKLICAIAFNLSDWNHSLCFVVLLLLLWCLRKAWLDWLRHNCLGR